MNTNELLKFVNYEILKSHNSLFEYLKKKTLKYFKSKGKKNITVDQILEHSAYLLQSDDKINYDALIVEQLK